MQELTIIMFCFKTSFPTSDYVKSIEIPKDMALNFEEVLDSYEGDDLDSIMKKIYDDGEIDALRPILEKNKNI